MLLPVLWPGYGFRWNFRRLLEGRSKFKVWWALPGIGGRDPALDGCCGHCRGRSPGCLACLQVYSWGGPATGCLSRGMAALCLGSGEESSFFCPPAGEGYPFASPSARALWAGCAPHPSLGGQSLKHLLTLRAAGQGRAWEEEQLGGGPGCRSRPFPRARGKTSAFSENDQGSFLRENWRGVGCIQTSF